MSAPYNLFEKQWKERVGSRKTYFFHFFGKTTEGSVNLDANLIELSLERGDHTPGPLLFPCHKNNENVTSYKFLQN